MGNFIRPDLYGLHRKTVIEEIAKNHVAIVINRKSRIIMSDGKKLIEKAIKIKEITPDTKVSIKISGPLCSKTAKFLSEHEVDII
jgi:hypothetical protein